MLNKKIPLNQTKTTQRFSIRKLTIGATSVLLGFFFFSANGNQVRAATNAPESAQAALVQTQSKETAATEETNKTQENNQTTSSASNETSELKVTNAKATEAKTLNDNKVETPAKVDAVQTTKDVTTDKPSLDSAKKDALIPGAGNTEQAGKVNGKGNNATITNVPSDITYDYSISAKNKKTGQTEEVHSAASGKGNDATVNINNSSDIEAHFSLSNTTNQDKVIGNNEWNNITPENYNKTRHNDEQAALYINVGGKDRTLKIDGSKAATIVVTKNGQVIANDPDSEKGLEVDYLAADGKWYKYDDFVQKFHQDAISNVTQIGFRGVLPGDATATMNVPLIFDANGTNVANQITIKAANDKGIRVTTDSNNLKPLWSKTDEDVKTAPIDFTYRNDTGHYTRVPDNAEIWQEVADNLSKEGKDTSSLLEIVNSGEGFDITGNNIYSAGSFRILLPELQNVLQKYGYSVNPSGTSYQSLMPYYTYNATSTKGSVRIYEDAKNGGGEIKYSTSHPYFYIEVHKIIDTKPASFEEKSNEAKNFNIKDVVSDLFDVKDRNATGTGNAYGNIAVDPSNATIVSITDAKGNTVSKIDGNTPAGVYTVTVGYKLNGSSDSAMFITKTAQVTITPLPVQPTNPVKPSQPTDPTTPVTPSTPVQPTTPITPVQPTTPVNPSQPTAPVQPSNVRPLPEKDDSNKQDNKTTKKNTQKGNKTNKKNTQKSNKTITPKATNVSHNNKGKVVSPKPTELNNVTKKVAPKAAVLNNHNAKANVQNATYVKKDAKTLPQTGDKNENNLSVLGLAAAAIAGLFGMGAFRKKRN
ncbi:MAG: YSIRK-type signal peptide-containing protein [Lactobacillus sp.]